MKYIIIKNFKIWILYINYILKNLKWNLYVPSCSSSLPFKSISSSSSSSSCSGSSSSSSTSSSSTSPLSSSFSCSSPSSKSSLILSIKYIYLLI